MENSIVFPKCCLSHPKLDSQNAADFCASAKHLARRLRMELIWDQRRGGWVISMQFPTNRPRKCPGGLFMKKNGVEPDPLKTYEKPLGSVRLNREQSFLKVWKFKCESKGGGECADMLCIHCLSSQSQPEWMFAQYRPTISCETWTSQLWYAGPLRAGWWTNASSAIERMYTQKEDERGTIYRCDLDWFDVLVNQELYIEL